MPFYLLCYAIFLLCEINISFTIGHRPQKERKKRTKERKKKRKKERKKERKKLGKKERKKKK